MKVLKLIEYRGERMLVTKDKLKRYKGAEFIRDVTAEEVLKVLEKSIKKMEHDPNIV